MKQWRWTAGAVAALLASCAASPVSQDRQRHVRDTAGAEGRSRACEQSRAGPPRVQTATARRWGATRTSKRPVQLGSFFTCDARVTFEDRMKSAVRAFLGKNVRLAITRLGYPTSREILGDTVYEWRDDHYDPVSMPVVSGTSGDVGGIFFSGSTHGNEYVPVQAACSIQLAAAADGSVKGAYWRGNERGCAAYLQAIQAP